MEPFSLPSRLRSIRDAVRGIGVLFGTQHNAWLHAVATALVILGGVAFELSASEWQVIVLAMMAVWVAEGLNTAFEFLCDVASPEYHPIVKQAKDVAAGAVLLSAVGATVIGLLVFGPRLLALLGRA